MSEVHPEIRKYWKRFYKREILQSRDGSYYYYRCDNNDFAIVIVAWDNLGKTPLQFQFDGKWYSEEEILHVFKLKAFI